MKEDKPTGFWSKRIADLTENRNRQNRDSINKAVRIVVNHFIESHIGTLVLGLNKAQSIYWLCILTIQFIPVIVANKQGTTIAIATHNSSVAAQTDRVIWMVDGMVVEAAIGH